MKRIAIALLALFALVAPLTPASAAPEPILAKGMKHPAVKKVQKALGVARTGYFGPKTRKAVKRYQRARGIPATGIVGPKTWASIKSKKAKKKKAKKKAKNPMFAITLQLGDRNDTVKYLQGKLGVTPQSGYFGPITLSFVKALQSAAKLPVTGVVDRKTWRRVGKVRFTPPTSTPAPGSSTGTTATPTNATAAQILKIAASQQGVPYVATGYSPKEGFNCSSYTQWVYQQVGIDLGGAYTVWQYDKARKITAAQALPGDLVFFYNYKDNFIGHVGIYAGNGMVWHAPRTGRVVSLEKIWTEKVLYGRVLNQ